jgi:hypothetical protein
VLANRLAIVELHLECDRHHERSLAMHGDIRFVQRLVFALILFLALCFALLVPVCREGVDGENLVIQDLRSVNRLVEVPVKVLAGNFFNGL